VLGRGVRGQRDERWRFQPAVAIARDHPPHRLNPVHAGHLQVHQDAGENIGSRRGDRQLTVDRHVDFIPGQG